MTLRKSLLFCTLTIVTSSLFGVDGCATVNHHSSSQESSWMSDDEHFLVDVPESGFAFEAEKWWVVARSYKKDDIIPVVLSNQIFPAQVMVVVMRSHDGNMEKIAYEEYRREAYKNKNISTLSFGRSGEVRFATFFYTVAGAKNGAAQEYTTFACSDKIPGVIFTFYGAWMEDDEDVMSEQMQEMVETLQEFSTADSTAKKEEIHR